MSEEGYVTIAVGGRRFLEMAVDLALSLREHDRRPFSLITDERLRARLGPYRELFDQVVLLPPELRAGRARKFGLARLSPYRRTMYLDADSLVLASLERAWQSARGHPLMLVGELLGEEHDMRHHHRSTRALMRRHGTPRYLKSNSGLVYAESGAGEALLAQCHAFYRDELMRGASAAIAPPDELAFGVIGGRHEVAVFPEPGPMLWRNEIRALDLAAPHKPLLHLIGAPQRATWRALQAAIRRRRSMHGLRPDSRWMWEMRRLKAMLNR